MNASSEFPLEIVNNNKHLHSTYCVPGPVVSILHVNSLNLYNNPMRQILLLSPTLQI